MSLKRFPLALSFAALATVACGKEEGGALYDVTCQHGGKTYQIKSDYGLRNYIASAEGINGEKIQTSHNCLAFRPGKTSGNKSAAQSFYDVTCKLGSKTYQIKSEYGLSNYISNADGVNGETIQTSHNCLAYRSGKTK